jgi:hypothetical protein
MVISNLNYRNLSIDLIKSSSFLMALFAKNNNTITKKGMPSAKPLLVITGVSQAK